MLLKTRVLYHECFHFCDFHLDGSLVLYLLPAGQNRTSAPNFGGEQDHHGAAEFVLIGSQKRLRYMLTGSETCLWLHAGWRT